MDPPIGETAKLNADGGLSQQGTHGAADVMFRDNNGYYLGAS